MAEIQVIEPSFPASHGAHEERPGIRSRTGVRPPVLGNGM